MNKKLFFPGLTIAALSGGLAFWSAFEELYSFSFLRAVFIVVTILGFGIAVYGLKANESRPLERGERTMAMAAVACIGISAFLALLMGSMLAALMGIVGLLLIAALMVSRLRVRDSPPA